MDRTSTLVEIYHQFLIHDRIGVQRGSFVCTKPPFYPMFKEGWTLPWTIRGERLITEEISQIVVRTGTAFKSHIILKSK